MASRAVADTAVTVVHTEEAVSLTLQAQTEAFRQDKDFRDVLTQVETQIDEANKRPRNKARSEERAPPEDPEKSWAERISWLGQNCGCKLG